MNRDDWIDYQRKWLEAERDLIRRAEELRAERDRQGAPIVHRTPSPTQTYESLDHFLFQPEIHWNGRTVDDA